MEEHFRASVLHALPQQYDSIIKQIDDGDDSAGASLDMSACRPRPRCICCALSTDPLRRHHPRPLLVQYPSRIGIATWSAAC